MLRAMTVKLTCLSALAALVVLVAACPRAGRDRTTPDGTGEVTATGAPVSKAVLEGFADAYRQYEQAKAGGLDEGECRTVAGLFDNVSSRVESGLPEALFNIGMVWQECGDHDKARDYFRQSNDAARAHSKSKMPGFSPALVQLGAYEYRAGRKGPARQMFEQAREADRRSEEAYTNLGILLREERDWGKAQLDLRRALAVNSDFMTAFAQMALLYLELAVENPQMLDITELVCQQATARAREIKSRPADVAPIHNVWGLALVRKGDVVRAVEQFDAARQRNPDFFEAHMNYGAINLSFRGYTAAEQAFREALRLQPEDYEANISLGAALRGTDRLAEARTAYEKARTIDPSQPQAYYNLAVLMQDYEMSTVGGGMPAQIALLGKAKQVYREFITKCQAKRSDCVRQRPGEPDQDMTALAEKRIKACDETIAGLREAATLAAEAERLSGGEGATKAPEGTTR